MVILYHWVKFYIIMTATIFNEKDEMKLVAGGRK